MTRTISRALLVAGLAAAGLGVSLPASAAPNCAAICSASVEASVNYENVVYRADVNNYQKKLVASTNGRGIHVDLYESNTGGMFKLYVDAGKTFTWYLPQKVTKFRVCGPNGFGGDFCSDWAEPALS